ncbi:MAG TPA: hypothetical protein VF158_05000 [Longimicrobiales bacterium]
MRGAGRRALALAGLAAVASAGCAGLFAHGDLAPSGLARSDEHLRRMLAFGRADSALSRVVADEGVAPDDELLRALYAGILAHYAGAYDSSNAALQRAADLAEDRYTKRISRAALSLITSDNALPYEPGWAERLLIHYYGALNRLRQRDPAGAAVEARRLGLLLEREAERERDPRTTPLLAFLRYFTGVVFEVAGERNDADVAYRNALMLAARDDAPLPTEVPLPDSLGEVVVVVEQGFVAHRVEQSMIVMLHPVEVAWLTGRSGDERAAAAAEIAARIVAGALDREPARPWYDRRPPTLRISLPPDSYFAAMCAEQSIKASDDGDQGKRQNGNADDCPREDENPYFLRVAWPVYRLDREPVTGVRVTGGGVAEPLRFPADVSAAVVRDFADERTLIVARTVARAVTKMALTKGIEKNVGGDDDAWIGRVLGALTNVGTALLEQADTRSWLLLPGRIGIARLRLPAGTHDIALELPGGSRDPRIEVGAVDVRAGRIAVIPVRIWQ